MPPDSFDLVNGIESEELPSYLDSRLLASVANGYLPDQAALSFFMYTYSTHSSFHYLPRIYNKLLDQTLDESARLNLERAISIPALLLLSQELHEPSLQATARCRYTSVLATTQTALEDPQRATLDSTLSSILLLGLVEAIEFRGRADPTGWDAHILGAATLIEMRGPQQLEDHTSRQLYFHASANIKRRCALRMLRVPNGIRRLHQQLIRIMEEEGRLDTVESVTLHASVVLEDYADLRLDIATGTFSPADWLRQAVKLGDEVNRLLDVMRRDAPYESIAADSSKISLTATVTPTSNLSSFGNTFHIYPSPRVCKRWNDLRMMRLYIAESTRDSIRAVALTEEVSKEKPSFPLHPTIDSAQHLARALEAGKHVSTEILQSVPYMLQMSNATKLTASALILPLTSISISGMAPLNLRLAARESLQYMHDGLGVPHSAESLHVIGEKENLEMW